MSNPLATGFKATIHYLENVGKAVFGQLKVQAVQFFHSFAKDELGKLAVAAVQFSAENATATPEQKLQAAKDKLIALGKDAGHDLAAGGQSNLNWLIETALQTVKAEVGKGIVALGESK